MIHLHYIKTFWITTALITMVGHFSFSQSVGALTKDELKNLYDSTAILDLAGGYELNGEKIKYGFFSKNLKKELKRSKTAWQSYRIFQKRSAIGYIAVVSAIPIMIISTAVTLNPAIGIALAVAPYFAGFLLISTAPDYRSRSIWLYNRDAISGNLTDP
ncbi:hypothetical protein N8Z47_04370 [Salibacteraceae bacterium]|nr:hypothetical protein [Salibacteraceae bacterium]